MAKDTFTERVIKRYDKLVGQRANWDEVWRDIAYFMSSKNLIGLGERTSGEELTDEQLDPTAEYSNEILASSLQSGLTNPAQKWMRLKTSNDVELNDDKARDWLEKATLKQLQAYGSSNLTSELGEVYRPLGAFGTAAIFEGESPTDMPKIMGDFRGFRFQAFPIGAYVVEEDAFGRVNSFMVREVRTIEAMIARWGKDSISMENKRLAEEDPLKEITLVHAIIPQQDTRFPWRDLWIEYKTKHLVFSGGYREFPVMVVRWSTNSGEPYGRGPGHIALPAVRGANKLMEYLLRGLGVSVLPPLKSRLNSVIGAIDANPGEVTVMRNMDDLQPLVSGARIDFGKMGIDDFRGIIRQIFLVDYLLQLLARDTPAMTATEVQVKLQLLQQIIGPAYQRITSDLLKPMVERGFAMMLRANAFRELGPIPASIRGQNVTVEFEGPLSRGQRGQELLGIERTLAMTQGIINVTQDVSIADNLDGDEAFRLSARISGAPESVIRNADDRDLRREMRKQEQAEQMRLQELMAVSEAGGKAAPLIKTLQEGQGGGQG